MKFFKWLIGLFESNGKVPKPNKVRNDYEAEYQKIKNHPIMAGVSIHRMQNGEYSIVKKGKPIPSLMVMNYTFKDGFLSGTSRTTKKWTCCKMCVEYYNRTRKHLRESTSVGVL